MKLNKKRFFSAILAVSLFLNSTGMTVLAESENESVAVGLETETSIDEPGEQNSETGAAGSDADSVAEPSDTTEETVGDGTDETEEKQTGETADTDTTTAPEEPPAVETTDPDEMEEGSTEEEIPEETDGETPEETEEELPGEETAEEELEEEETSEETDELFPGLPKSYKLSAKQIEDKLTLAEHTDEIAGLEDNKGNTDAYVKGEVLYLTDSREDAQAVAGGFGGELESYGDGVAVIKLSEKRTVSQAVRAASSTSYNLPAVWPNYYYKLFDDYNDPALDEGSADYQWVHEYVGDFYAWDEGYKGAGVKIGIIDTGVYSSHEDLYDNVVQNLSMVSESATATTTDPGGHGTHVAGIAAAVGNNGIGGAGIAPDAKIYAYSVMDSEGLMQDDYILRAINRAVSDNVDIVNMSLGSGYYNGLEEAVIENAYNNGVAIFAASGNEATNGYEYPASYDKVCSVAAIAQDGSKAGFTNYGDKIDLAFPGVDMYSTYNNTDHDKDGVLDLYASLQGTSMACPAAAGTAAVILSASDTVNELKGKSGKARVDALFSVMKKNTIKSSSAQMGSGTTYLPKVLGIKVESADAVPATPVPDKSVTTFTEEWVNIPVECSSSGVTLYYSIDGKKPVYKNGTVTNGQPISDGSAYVGGAKQVTLNVIAVNHVTGKASKVASQKYTFEPAPREVTITAADSVNRVAKGKSLTLSAAVEPSYAKFGNGKVEWSVVGRSDVTVSNGKVTVKSTAATGDCIIQAKAGDITGQITLSICEAANISKIVFATKKYTIYTGDSQSLVGENNSNITVTGGGVEDVVWSSSNKKVATVDANGIVAAIAPGKATIKATANDGGKKSGSCTITVKQLAETIELSGPDRIAAGKSATIQAKITPANVSSKKLIWSVTPENNVTVNANGKVSVKAGASGIYTVTAKEKDVPEGKDAKTASIQFEVTTSPVTKIEIPKTVNLFTISGNYNAPREFQLTPKVTGGDGQSLKYTSSAPGVASVDSAGLITARSSGKATITCSATDGSNKKATCSVVVSVPMSRITIVPKNANEGIVSVGKKITLSAKVSNNFGKAANQKVKWSIMPGGEDYASVDQKGVVQGKAADKAADGSDDFAQVRVKAEAADGSGASAVYTVYVIPEVTKFDVDVNGIYFTPYIVLRSDIEWYAPSYDVQISGAKGIGFQKDSNTGNYFWIMPKYATTNRTSAQIEESGVLYNKEIKKVTVKVTLKDGSNRKVTKQVRYVAASDGGIYIPKSK